MLDDKAVINKLNHILGTLRDGEKGYAEAAEEVTHAQYRSMFMDVSRERAQLAEEVKAEIRRLGGDPDDSSSVGAALHRAWINVRDAITGKDDYAVIAEVERGEDVAVDNYQDVMKESLPADIQALLSRQYAQVKAAHDRARDLKHSLKAD